MCACFSSHTHTHTQRQKHSRLLKRHTLATKAEAHFNDLCAAHIHASVHTVLDCSLRVTGFISGQDKRLQSCTEHIFDRVEATQKCLCLVKQIRQIYYWKLLYYYDVIKQRVAHPSSFAHSVCVSMFKPNLPICLFIMNNRLLTYCSYLRHLHVISSLHLSVWPLFSLCLRFHCHLPPPPTCSQAGWCWVQGVFGWRS